MERGRLRQNVGCGVTMRVDLFEELSRFRPGGKGESLGRFTERLFRLRVEEDPPPRGWAPSFMSDASRARITAYFEAETAGGRMLGLLSHARAGCIGARR